MDELSSYIPSISEFGVDEGLKKRKDNLRTKVKKLSKNPYFWIFIGILILALILRLYIFSLTSNQGLWWDEAEYLSKAKQMAYGWEYTDFWNPHKPILLSWVASSIYLLGGGEMALRLLIILFSIGSVCLIYFPSKEIFKDKKIALLSSFLLAIFWVHLFFSGRILVDLPSTMVFLLFWYFFAKGFIKEENSKYLYLSAIFFGISFMFRAVYGVIAIPILLYAILEKKMGLIKKKKYWIALLLVFLTISPLIFWLFAEYPSDPLGEFLGFKHNRFSAEARDLKGTSGTFDYLKDLNYVLGKSFLILLIIGSFFYFSDVFLGFDKILKKDSKELRLKLFILLLIFFLLAIWGLTKPYVEQRDSFAIILFLFGIIGVGLTKVWKLISKYSKPLAAIVVLIFLVLGTHYHLTNAIDLTKAKAEGPYNAIKQAGLWIKENTNETDIVYSKAAKEMLYYTGREVWDPIAYDYYYGEGNKKPEEVTKREIFEEKRIKYLEIDVIERPPPWFTEWVQEQQGRINPVAAWPEGAGEDQNYWVVVYEVVH